MKENKKLTAKEKLEKIIDRAIYHTKLFKEIDRRADPKAIKWAKKNKWFGRNKKLTYLAYDFHDLLVDDIKIDPNTKQYYQLIDLLMKPFLLKKIPQFKNVKGKIVRYERKI